VKRKILFCSSFKARVSDCLWWQNVPSLLLRHPEAVKRNCLTMYLNGMGFRAIERVTGVNHNTVINWVKQAATGLPNAPEIQKIPKVAQLDVSVSRA
jgi:hypothetical protein